MKGSNYCKNFNDQQIEAFGKKPIHGIKFVNPKATSGVDIGSQRYRQPKA